jgi:hypothetical protein
MARNDSLANRLRRESARGERGHTSKLRGFVENDRDDVSEEKQTNQLYDNSRD